MSTYKSLLPAVMILFCTSVFSQQIEFVNPAELLEQVQVLGDSGNYAEVIKTLRKIPERDTAYSIARLRLVYAYFSNKQYDSVIAVCTKQLKEPSSHRVEYLKMQGLALSSSGSHQQAITFLQKAIGDYPTDVPLHYGLAAIHYDNKEYEKASEHFFKILKINPYHPATHLNLARIAIGQGRKVHGMMAMGMYLAIKPKDNEKLVLINNFVDNQVTDEGTFPVFGTNGGQRLDQMIRAKIVMEEDFKSRFSFSAPVIRQYELLFDQLNLLTSDPTDPYLTHYLPIYKAIKDQSHVEPFIYHMITSSNIQEGQKWRNKNEKILKAFFATTNIAMGESRKRLAFPELGFSEPTDTWYDDSNRVSAIGKKVNDVREGQWLFMHDNSEKAAEGKFNKEGVKVGVWTYYYDDGRKKSVEDMGSGLGTGYSRKGHKTEEFYLKNNKIEGDAKVFYRSGQLKESVMFSDGARNGKAITYYPHGQVKSSFTYAAGKINGPYESFHANGKLYIKTTYKEGFFNGKYTAYYSNGKTEATGDYVEGYPVGKWTYYHRNAQIEREGSYNAKGEAVGEWKLYDYTGQPTEKRNYDDQGRYHGEVIYYEEGKQRCVSVYKKGLITKNTYYNAEGKTIFTAGNNNGTFYNKTYNLDGTLRNEGNYVAGKAQGIWKAYDRYGNVIREYNWKDDELDGKNVYYYSWGQKSSESTYSKGRLEGPYYSYTKDGKVYQQGWYSAGEQEQRWVTYHPDGAIQSDEYYIEGSAVGTSYYYSLGGQLYCNMVVNGSEILDMVYFNSKGVNTSSKRQEKFNDIIEQQFSNKKVKRRNELSSGYYNKHRSVYYPDGTIHYDYEMLNNKEHGAYVFHEMDGTQTTKGWYEDDQRTGLWQTFHENGKLHSIGKYYENEKDSVWVYYYDNGSILSKGTWNGGNRHGNFTYYNYEGKPLIEKLFKYDELIAYRSLTGATPGEWVEFKGTGKVSVKYADGKMAFDQEFRNGLLHGSHKEYHSNGTLAEDKMYINGDLHGEYKEYYPNGKMKEKGSFLNDDMHGTVEYFSADGKLVRSSEFKYGFRHGKSTLYVNGKKTKEYTFWYGTVEN